MGVGQHVNEELGMKNEELKNPNQIEFLVGVFKL
jgi:hypothetical protein